MISDYLMQTAHPPGEYQFSGSSASVSLTGLTSDEDE